MRCEQGLIVLLSVDDVDCVEWGVRSRGQLVLKSVSSISLNIMGGRVFAANKMDSIPVSSARLSRAD